MGFTGAWPPAPTGEGATPMLKTLRALNAQIWGPVTVGGVITGTDIMSDNWDGAIPLDLSAFDTGATAGFAFDSSLGSGQWMGDVFIGGNLQLDTGGAFRSAAATTDHISIAHEFFESSYLNINWTRDGESSPSYGIRGDMFASNDEYMEIFSDDGTSKGQIDIRARLLARVKTETFQIIEHSNSTVMAEIDYGGGHPIWKVRGGILLDPDAGISGNMGLTIWNEHASGYGVIELGGKLGAYIDFKNAEADDNDARIRLYGNDALSIQGADLTVDQTIIANGATSSAYGIDLDGHADGDMFLRFGSDRPFWFENRGTGAAASLNLMNGSNKFFDFRMSTDAIYFRFHTGGLRGPDGSLSSPSFAFLNQTQTGFFLSSSTGDTECGIGTGGAEMATFMNKAVGADEVRILPAYASTGSDTHLGITSSGLLRRQTSARKYKKHITYDVQEYLQAVVLKPSRFWRDDADPDPDRPNDGHWFYDFIANDWGDQDRLFAFWNDDDPDDVEMYRQGAVNAVFAAKLNRLEDHMMNCPHFKEDRDGVH